MFAEPPLAGQHAEHRHHENEGQAAENVGQNGAAPNKEQGKPVQVRTDDHLAKEWFMPPFRLSGRAGDEGGRLAGGVVFGNDFDACLLPWWSPAWENRLKPRLRRRHAKTVSEFAL